MHLLGLVLVLVRERWGLYPMFQLLPGLEWEPGLLSVLVSGLAL